MHVTPELCNVFYKICNTYKTCLVHAYNQTLRIVQTQFQTWSRNGLFNVKIGIDLNLCNIFNIIISSFCNCVSCNFDNLTLRRFLLQGLKRKLHKLFLKLRGLYLSDQHYDLIYLCFITKHSFITSFNSLSFILHTSSVVSNRLFCIQSY